MNSSSVTIETAKASGYLQQICKHFGHKIEVEFSPDAGWIKFDFGQAYLKATADSLKVTAEAGSDEDLVRLKRVFVSHLERFAFREELNINWES